MVGKYHYITQIGVRVFIFQCQILFSNRTSYSEARVFFGKYNYVIILNFIIIYYYYYIHLNACKWLQLKFTLNIELWV